MKWLLRKINLFSKNLRIASLIWFPTCNCQPSAVSWRPQLLIATFPRSKCFLFQQLGLHLPHPLQAFFCLPSWRCFSGSRKLPKLLQTLLGGQRIVQIKTTTELGRSCKNPDGWPPTWTIGDVSFPLPFCSPLLQGNSHNFENLEIKLKFSLAKCLFDSQYCWDTLNTFSYFIIFTDPITSLLHLNILRNGQYLRNRNKFNPKSKSQINRPFLCSFENNWKTTLLGYIRCSNISFSFVH